MSNRVGNSFHSPFAGAMLFLGVISCTYDPGNELTFREVDQIPVTGTFSLDTIAESDTIILYQTSDINFTVDLDRGEIKEVQAYAEGRKLESYVTDGKGAARVYVGYGGLSTGTYALSLEIISSTASKSVADNLGLETTTIKKSWPLKVDIDPPPTPDLKFSVSYGFL